MITDMILADPIRPPKNIHQWGLVASIFLCAGIFASAKFGHTGIEVVFLCLQFLIWVLLAVERFFIKLILEDTMFYRFIEPKADKKDFEHVTFRRWNLVRRSDYNNYQRYWHHCPPSIKLTFEGEKIIVVNENDNLSATLKYHVSIESNKSNWQQMAKLAARLGHHVNKYYIERDLRRAVGEVMKKVAEQAVREATPNKHAPEWALNSSAKNLLIESLGIDPSLSINVCAFFI